jgi:hypothetical protein
MKSFYKASVPHRLLKATEANTRKKEKKERNLKIYSSDIHQTPALFTHCTTKMITALFGRKLPDFRKRTALLRGIHVPTGCSDKFIFENKEECRALVGRY